MPEINFELPLPPWTHADLGEELYCKVATELGYFNPKTEPITYRPDLDPTPHLETIRAQRAKKSPVKPEGGN